MACKLMSSHMPDIRMILNLIVFFTSKSTENTYSLDLTYTCFSHLIWSCHVQLFCILDSSHMEPSFDFHEVLNYYLTNFALALLMPSIEGTSFLAVHNMTFLFLICKLV